MLVTMNSSLIIICVLKYLSQCDEVIFMNQGKVMDQGPHNILVNRNEEYASVIRTFSTKENADGEEIVDDAVSSSDVEMINAG